MSSFKIESSFKSVQKPRATQAQQEQKLRSASNMYEKQFLREMVKAMRQTVKPSGLVKTNMAENIYRQKLDEEYVNSWGEQGGIGISDVIYDQLHGQIFPNRQMPRPKGPISVDPKSKVLPILPEVEKPGFKEISLLLPRSQEQGSLALKVPWDASLQKVVSEQDGRHTAWLDHGEGLVSVLSFRGTMVSGAGDEGKLSAGTDLGVLDPDSTHVSWSVRQAKS